MRIARIIALLCFVACSSSKSEPQERASTSEIGSLGRRSKLTTFEVHEWALVDVVPGLRIDAVAGHRKDSRKPTDAAEASARKPVMYFHADSEVTVSVSIDLGVGRVQEVWPQVGKPRGHTLRFGEIRVSPATQWCAPPTGTTSCSKFPATDGFCERLQLGTYFAAGATCINYGGRALPFIFYRSDYPYQTLRFDSVTEPGGVEMKRAHRSDSPGDLVHIVRTRRDVFVRAANQQGYMVTPTDDDALNDVKQQFEVSLREIGMTTHEANAFLAAWWSELFEPLPADSPRLEESFVLFWLSPKEINRLSSVTFRPEPSAFKRAFLARWHTKIPLRESYFQKLDRSHLLPTR